MATLAQMNEWRDRLQSARFSGTRRVRDSNGEEVEYRSDLEIGRALAALETEIKVAAGIRPSNQVRFQTSKGL